MDEDSVDVITIIYFSYFCLLFLCRLMRPDVAALEVAFAVSHASRVQMLSKIERLFHK